MDHEERLEKIETILDEIRNSGLPILVEGDKDRASLNELGIYGEMFFASRHSLISLAEKISETQSEVIILTDWDRRGDKLAGRITAYLRSMGVIPNNSHRNMLKALVKKEIKDVESLNKYVEKLRNKKGKGFN